IGFGLSSVIHMKIINPNFDMYKTSALGLGYSILETVLEPSHSLLLLKTYYLRVVLQEHSLSWVGIDIECKRNSQNEPNNDCPPIYQDVMHQRCNELRHEISSNGGSLRSRCSDLKHEISSISGSVRSQSRCSGSLRSHRKASEISELIRDSMSRNDSLPPVLEKEPLRTGSIHSEHQKDGESVHDDDEHDRSRGVQYSASIKKSRTSSFVGQMAQEIVNRV
ncbi:hypothetical protein NPIL_682511, partial [Nephila pilipes]